jgi:hypothetical protein
MRHPKAMAWEAQLKQVFDRIDTVLEERYGQDYPLHPARSTRGTTGNCEYDGLFSVGGKFTAGFGSEHGPGYTVDCHLSTLKQVPADVVETIEEEVIGLLREQLPAAFPGRDLTVSRDGHTYKIHGDLSLGDL